MHPGSDHQHYPHAGGKKLAFLAGRFPIPALCDLWILRGLYSSNPIPGPLSSVRWDTLCALVYGNVDVLLVAALAHEPLSVGRVYHPLCDCHGREYQISLTTFHILDWINPTPPQASIKPQFISNCGFFSLAKLAKNNFPVVL